MTALNSRRAALRGAASLSLGVALLGLGGCAVPESLRESAASASIPFVDLGGVRDWRAEGSRAMRIQAANGDWYRATFAAPCRGLAFRDSVGFVTDGLNEIDRFGSVIVGRGERCWFQSFERIAS
jgi:hypothetical protein